MSGYARRFNKSWYDKYSNWLEHSLKNDAFCCLCYLFATESEIASHYGGYIFISKGLRTWNNIKRFDKHIGGPDSIQNQCVKRCEDLYFLLISNGGDTFISKGLRTWNNTE